jgi:hypothetical protein
MRVPGSIAAAALLVAGCGRGEGPANAGHGADAAAPALNDSANGTAAAPSGRDGNAAAAAAPSAARWDLQSSGEGAALALAAADGGAAIRLFCPAGGRQLLVNVTGFQAIGSEERLSFGSGGDAVALVADTRGDRQRGGVSGTGAVPRNLAALLARPLSASYGAQTSGPHAAPPPELARAFAAACGGRSAEAPPQGTPGRPGLAHPCHFQDDRRIEVAPLRAVGTEPFWGARIEGRCVTYSHPDDQAGTRVWTRYAPLAGGGGTWSGALGGRAFELRIRPQAGCSDGMSDRRYPFAAELLVGGERRSGCAAPP